MRPLGVRFIYATFFWLAYAWAACAQTESSLAPILTVDQAVQMALTGNRDLKIAGLSVEKAKWQVKESKTKLLPSFNAFLFASGQLTSPSFLFKEGTFGKINGVPIPSLDTHIPLSTGFTGYALAQASQPITQLYKAHLYVREQELSQDISSEQYKGKRQSVLANVKQAYYAVLQTENGLEAAEAAVKQYEEASRLAKQYLSQEVVLKSDSLEADARLAQAKYQIVDLKNTLQNQKDAVE
jgi:outer membrane protein TolC